MTTAHEPAGMAAGGPGLQPADDDVNVLLLAGQRPPGGGAWLLVTAADGTADGTFAAQSLPGERPLAFGGDVVIHLAPPPEPRPSRRPRVGGGVDRAGRPAGAGRGVG